MRKAGFVYNDIFLNHKMPHGHPESAGRLISIMNVMRKSSIWDKFVQLTPRKAVTGELSAVHTMKHIERMSKLTGYADPDTYLSENTHEAALYAAGAVLTAIDNIKSGNIERAFCAVRPPGHHAEADRPMGFCIFNNIAIGARYAQSKGYNKVFIVDFDVHHGNGTEHIFEEDPSVFYFSTHQSHHYPGTGLLHDKGKGPGEGYTVNYPMDAGMGDSDYAIIYNDILPGLVRDFDPDIMLVSAGYDMLATDPLAQIRLSMEGVEMIVRSILEAKEIPAVFSLEGGYDINALAAAVLITARTLLAN